MELLYILDLKDDERDFQIMEMEEIIKNIQTIFHNPIFPNYTTEEDHRENWR